LPSGGAPFFISHPRSAILLGQEVKVKAPWMPNARGEPTYTPGPPPGLAAPFEGSHRPPPWTLGPPDILQIDSREGLLTQPLRGPHLVRPDGTVGLGPYGPVQIAGLTAEQAREAIARAVHAQLTPNAKSLKEVLDGLCVDVAAFNSKVYYVIADRIGFGEIVQRFPLTGNDTVLDAVAGILEGLPPSTSDWRLWVERRAGKAGLPPEVLKVDWVGLSQRGEMATNYPLLPGDRLYVKVGGR
jgi:polysaccharide export outer membrane protein